MPDPLIKMTNLHDHFGDFQIIESQSMTETYQFRFPRSKKKRIKKKWQKRPNNFKTRPRKDFLLYGNYVICNPIMAAKLRRQIQIREDAVEESSFNKYIELASKFS